MAAHEYVGFTYNLIVTMLENCVAAVVKGARSECTGMASTRMWIVPLHPLRPAHSILVDKPQTQMSPAISGPRSEWIIPIVLALMLPSRDFLR